MTSQETGEAVGRLDGRARALVAAAVAYTAVASIVLPPLVAAFIVSVGWASTLWWSSKGRTAAATAAP
ncbi:MAG: hypothetical protein M0Z40_05165 [Actinomycetota bacterium]|nr:hypothetical protein [Actinomycetota bacterium]